MGDPLDGFEIDRTITALEQYDTLAYAKYATDDGFFYALRQDDGPTGPWQILRMAEPTSDSWEVVGETPSTTFNNFSPPELADGIWWWTWVRGEDDPVGYTGLKWSSDNGATWSEVEFDDPKAWASSRVGGYAISAPQSQVFCPVRDPVSGKWWTLVYGEGWPDGNWGQQEFVAYADNPGDIWTVTGTPHLHGSALGETTGQTFSLSFPTFLVNGVCHVISQCDHYNDNTFAFHRVLYRFSDGVDEEPEAVLLRVGDADPYQNDYYYQPEPPNPYSEYGFRLSGVGDTYFAYYETSMGLDGYYPSVFYSSTSWPPSWSEVDFGGDRRLTLDALLRRFYGDGIWLLELVGGPPENESVDEPKTLVAGTLESLTEVEIEPTEPMAYLAGSYLGAGEWTASGGGFTEDGLPSYVLRPPHGGGWGISLA